MRRVEGKDGPLRVYTRDSINMEQRFWRAEVLGRTVVTTTHGHFWHTGTTKKSYPSNAAADRAARAELASKLRVGFVSIPESELIPLMRLVFKVGVRGEGDGSYPTKLPDPSTNTVYACRFQQYWRGQVTASSFVATHGEIGGPIVSRTFPLSNRGLAAYRRDEDANVGRSWYQSSRKELAPIERHIKAMNKRLAKRPGPPIDVPAPTRLIPTIVTRKLPRGR